MKSGSDPRDQIRFFVVLPKWSGCVRLGRE